MSTLVRLTPVYNKLRKGSPVNVELPVGRKELAMLWWKECPKFCRAQENSNHPCRQYCYVVRRNVSVLSKKIISGTDDKVVVDAACKHRNLIMLRKKHSLSGPASYELVLGNNIKDPWMRFHIEVLSTPSTPRDSWQQSEVPRNKRKRDWETIATSEEKSSDCRWELLGPSAVEEDFRKRSRRLDCDEDNSSDTSSSKRSLFGRCDRKPKYFSSSSNYGRNKCKNKQSSRDYAASDYFGSCSESSRIVLGEERSKGHVPASKKLEASSSSDLCTRITFRGSSKDVKQPQTSTAATPSHRRETLQNKNKSAVITPASRNKLVGVASSPQDPTAQPFEGNKTTPLKQLEEKDDDWLSNIQDWSMICVKNSQASYDDKAKHDDDVFPTRTEQRLLRRRQLLFEKDELTPSSESGHQRPCASDDRNDSQLLSTYLSLPVRENDSSSEESSSGAVMCEETQPVAWQNARGESNNIGETPIQRHARSLTLSDWNTLQEKEDSKEGSFFRQAMIKLVIAKNIHRRQSNVGTMNDDGAVSNGTANICLPSLLHDDTIVNFP